MQDEGGKAPAVKAPDQAAGREGEPAAGQGKKAKKGHKQQMLLFSTTQRRY